MGKLDHLKIKKAPACFAGWAKNFNQHVDLVAGMEGGPGVDVQVAHSPRKLAPSPHGQPRPKEQPRGKILLTLRPSAISGIGVGGGAGGNTNGVTVNAVGYDGLLVGVIAGNAVASNYPILLRVGGGPGFSFFDENSFTNFDADGNVLEAKALRIRQASNVTNYLLDSELGIGFTANDFTNSSVVGSESIVTGDGTNTSTSARLGFSSTDGTNTANIGFDGLSIATATKAFSVPRANITHNIGVMTFVGCNSGNAANYLVIASEFF